MAYILGQYNHNPATGDDGNFKELINDGEAKVTDAQQDDFGVSSSGNQFVFQDQYFQISSGFTNDTYYYFKCWIRRLSSGAQSFTIKLTQPSDNTDTEQFIKNITVAAGLENEWVSVDFIFRPVIEFKRLVFQLSRQIQDYTAPRWPLIAYEEISKVKSIILSGDIKELLKIGVQSRPGLVMCINGEEIHTPRSGVFELRNGTLPVTFFSVVNAAIENNTSTIEYDETISIDDPTINNVLVNGTGGLASQMDVQGQRTLKLKEETENNSKDFSDGCRDYILSKAFSITSNQPKTISIDPFTIDYMYKTI